MEAKIANLIEYRAKRILELRLDCLTDAGHMDEVYDDLMEAIMHWPYDNRVLIVEPEQYFPYRDAMDKKRLRYLLRLAHKDNVVVVLKSVPPKPFTRLILQATGLLKDCFIDRTSALEAIARRM